MTRRTDLTFDPAPECERAWCCDLSCVWPSAPLHPIVWEGDQA